MDKRLQANGGATTFMKESLVELLKRTPITQILTSSGYRPDVHAVVLYNALRDPVIRLANGSLTIGGYAIDVNQFKIPSKFKGTVTETIPIGLQVTMYSNVVSDVEQFVYFAHCERADRLPTRPCTKITLQNCATTLSWEIAGQSRDPGAIGALVSTICSRLSPENRMHISELAGLIAVGRPICRLIDVCLIAGGLERDNPKDVDIICALCIAVGSFAGHFACAYLPCCNNTATAIDIIARSCPPSLPQLLGSLSPLLSRPLL